MDESQTSVADEDDLSGSAPDDQPDTVGGSEAGELAFESLLRRVARTSETTPDLPPGTVLNDTLCIERTLGRGGMGVVYLARHEPLSRQVALKLTSGPTTATRTARMVREAQAMASITHEHVVTVYDVGTVDDQVFIAMEYLDGGTIGSWLREAPRAWRDVVGVYIKAGRGLAAAHARGLIHRDFKPENVLMGSDDRVRVADFGLARATNMDMSESDMVTTGAFSPPGASFSSLLSGTGKQGSSNRGATVDVGGRLTATGAVAGTPAYMSLEQFAGGVIDERSDQFSFCVALFEALFGRRPYAGDTASSLVANIAAGRLVEPTTNTKVPAVVRRALQRGLSPDAEDRHASMEALLRELERAVFRRRRTTLAAGALAAVGGLSLWGATYQAREPTCEDAATLRGIWNDKTRDELRSEILNSAVADKQKVWGVAQAQIDKFVAEWEETYLHACTTSAAAKRETVLSCLDGEADELRGKLTGAVNREVPRAVGIASDGLTPPSGCRPRPEPSKADAAAYALDVRTREQWREGLRFYRAEKFDKALTIFEGIDFQPAAVNRSRTHGLCLSASADILAMRGRHDDAVSRWRLAIPILVGTDDIDTAIQTTLTLANALHNAGSTTGEAAMLTELANEWLPRAKDPDWVEPKVALLRALLLSDREPHSVGPEQVLRDAIEEMGDDAPTGSTYDLKMELGRVLFDHGKYSAAGEAFASIFAEESAYLPGNHTRVLSPRVWSAACAARLGDAEKFAQLTRELERQDPLPVFERILGLARADLLTTQGDVAGSAAIRQKILLDPRYFNPAEDPMLWAEQAANEARLGDHDAARVSLARVRAQPPTHLLATLFVELRTIEVALEMGDLEAAVEQLRLVEPRVEPFAASHPVAVLATSLRSRLAADE